MSKRSRKLKVTLVLLAVFLVMMGVVQIPWFSPSLEKWIGENIDRPMTELPMTSSGRVDFFAIANARLGQGVTPEENFVVDMVQVFGTGEIADRVELLRELSITTAPATSRWVGFQKSAEKAGVPGEQGNEKYFAAIEGTWSPSDYPVVAAWLASNQKNLEQLAEAALTKKRFYFPMLRNQDPNAMLIGALLPYVQHTREVARALSARAMLRINAGELDGAITDAGAIRRIGTLHQQSNTLVEHLVGYAIIGIAVGVETELLASGKLNAEQCRRLQQQVLENSKLENLARCIREGELNMALDCVQAFRRGDGQPMQAIGEPALPAAGLLANLTNWSICAGHLKSHYERIANVMEADGFAQRMEGLQQIENELIAEQEQGTQLVLQFVSGATGRGQAVGKVLKGMLTPAMQNVEQARLNAAANVMTAIGCAVEHYRLENGKLPQTLGDLEPDFIVSLPPDPFTGQPFKYRGTTTGYRIWSTGKDNIDGQIAPDGSLVEPPPDEPMTDDRVLDIKFHSGN